MKIQRTMPPAAAVVPVRGLAKGLAALMTPKSSAASRFVNELCDTFHVKHAFLVNSGKAALALTLRALSRDSNRRKVIIPAYTCFSVPSAVVKAGLDIVACDVLPDTLQFDQNHLAALVDNETLCVVPTHLFGKVVDMESVTKICQPKGAFVVEDAAQAMGSTYRGRSTGTIGDVGFFSFSRGKNISCGGGGVVLTNSPAIARSIEYEYDCLPHETWWEAAKSILEMIATTVLIRPNWYWLPSGLPILRLGETKFYRDFPIKKMSHARAATLAGWKSRLDAANAERQLNVGKTMQALSSKIPGGWTIPASDSAYVRLPVLLPSDKAKRKLLQCSAEDGLGVTGNYPSAVQDIPELRGRVAPCDLPGTREIVKRLVTVPVHHYVEDVDRQRICDAIAEVCSGCQEDTPEPRMHQSSSVTREMSPS